MSITENIIEAPIYASLLGEGMSYSTDASTFVLSATQASTDNGGIVWIYNRTGSDYNLIQTIEPLNYVPYSSLNLHHYLF